ncbi:MAG: sugar phosphate isomerase/epimerase family protein [Patescibacteria group bacterium]
MAKKLSVSNIAWKREDADDALAILKKFGIGYVEVAPTLFFDDVPHVSDERVRALRDEYLNKGFRFAAMQSLLYGAPEYSIFDDEKKRQYLFEYVAEVFRIARLLGIERAVFGSPKNRFMRDIDDPQNEQKAASFFKKLSDTAAEHTVTVCLEANPPEYGCNFITNTFEAIEWVKKIGHSNFKLNLDLNAILMNGSDIDEVMARARGLVGHIHVSAPHIGEIDDASIGHAHIAGAIDRLGYDGFVSLEMRAGISNSDLETLEKNLRIFTKYYGSGRWL